jgi:hypothetical protein
MRTRGCLSVTLDCTVGRTAVDQSPQVREGCQQPASTGGLTDAAACRFVDAILTQIPLTMLCSVAGSVVSVRWAAESAEAAAG